MDSFGWSPEYGRDLTWLFPAGRSRSVVVRKRNHLGISAFGGFWIPSMAFYHVGSKVGFMVRFRPALRGIAGKEKVCGGWDSFQNVSASAHAKGLEKAGI